MKGKKMVFRIAAYLIGIATLAAGITLNTKTGLGVSPLVSISFGISELWNLNFAAMTFLVYSAFVGIQALLLRRRFQLRTLLQIPFSFVFSLLLDLFSALLDYHFTLLWQNLLLLAVGIVLTGIGACLTVNMKFIANPADGLAGTVGEVTRRGMGFGKNIIDISAVVITLLIGLIFGHRVVGIGIGTVLSMILTGRIIALVNYLFKEKMTQAAGLC